MTHLPADRATANVGVQPSSIPGQLGVRVRLSFTNVSGDDECDAVLVDLDGATACVAPSEAATLEGKIIAAAAAPSESWTLAPSLDDCALVVTSAPHLVLMGIHRRNGVSASVGLTDEDARGVAHILGQAVATASASALRRRQENADSGE